MYIRKILYENKYTGRVRTVKRKLKDGTIKEYKYNVHAPLGYDSEGTQKLATSSGKKTKAYYNLVKEIKETYGPNRSEEIIDDLDKHIKVSVEMYKEKLGSIYRASTFRARLRGLMILEGNALFESYDVERYLYNMGADIDALQDKVGVPRAQFLDATNWKFKKNGEVEFTRPADKEVFSLYVAYESGVVRWNVK